MKPNPNTYRKMKHHIRTSLNPLRYDPKNEMDKAKVIGLRIAINFDGSTAETITDQTLAKSKDELNI